MERRAAGWTFDAGTGAHVSRKGALNEEHVALDVLDLIAELRALRLTDEEREALGFAAACVRYYVHNMGASQEAGAARDVLARLTGAKP